MLVKCKQEGENGDMSRNYGQFCGLARALDLVGERWALLVVRDLLIGPKRFTELQEGLHGIPTNVLTSRLRELEDAGVVQRRAQAQPGRGVVYELTDYGLELEEPVLRLGFWGAKALGTPEKDDFFSMDSLALALRGAFHPEKARGPQRLYELRVDGKSLRIAVKRGGFSAPASSPGKPDLVLETDAGVLSELFAGTQDVGAATSSGRARIDGDRADARRLFEMFRFPSGAGAHTTPEPRRR
jgi:DNA-binding HxlR family transcriptional regulator